MGDCVPACCLISDNEWPSLFIVLSESAGGNVVFFRTRRRARQACSDSSQISFIVVPASLLRHHHCVTSKVSLPSMPSGSKVDDASCRIEAFEKTLEPTSRNKIDRTLRQPLIIESIIKRNEIVFDSQPCCCWLHGEMQNKSKKPNAVSSISWMLHTLGHTVCRWIGSIRTPALLRHVEEWRNSKPCFVLRNCLPLKIGCCYARERLESLKTPSPHHKTMSLRYDWPFQIMYCTSSSFGITCREVVMCGFSWLRSSCSGFNTTCSPLCRHIAY